MDTLKTVGLAFLLWGGPFAIFYLAANFTMIQSVVLTLLAVLAISASRVVVKIGLRNPPDFDPFWVVIDPNWETLGSDYGICDARKMDEVYAAIPADKRHESMVASGLAFTVLTPRLVYYTTFGTFSGIDCRIHLREFRRSDNMMDWPVFYMRPSRLGEGKKKVSAFELGLELPRTSPERMATVRPRTEHQSTAIAYLPEIFFYPYSHRDAYWKGRNYFKIADRIRGEAERFGWTWKNSAEGREHAEHKYFSVEYGGIDPS